MKDILSFDLTNVLPESVVDAFADYWCDDDNIRKENLGEFIQRIAEYTIRTQQAVQVDAEGCPAHDWWKNNREFKYCPDCGRNFRTA